MDPFLQAANVFTGTFLSNFLESLPFLFIGALASGLVEVFVDRAELEKWLPRRVLPGVVAGSLLGLFLPVGQGGSVLLARRLLRKGVPFPMGVAFLMAAPALNPISIASAYAAFGGGSIFWGRAAITFIVAAGVGLLFSLQHEPGNALKIDPGLPLDADPDQDSNVSAGETRKGQFKRAALITADEFLEMGPYLVIGAGLAALVQSLVPQSWLLGIGRGTVLPVILFAILAGLRSLSPTVDAYAALAYTGSFTGGSILAFLVLGPMFNLKTGLMCLPVFRRKTIIYLGLFGLALTSLASAGWDLLSVR